MFNTAKTELVLSGLPHLLAMLVERLPAPVKVHDEKGDFHWEFPERSARVVVLCKLVRASSAIAAAWELCNTGFLAEASSLLRMTADYCQEVIAIDEGIRAGTFTTAQSRFIEQYFLPMPRTPDEFDREERRPYVGREEHLKSEARLISESGQDPDATRRLRRFLNRGYDGYVHGDYLTAMQLYHGARGEFEVSGRTENKRAVDATRIGVAGKLHEVVVAFEFTGIVLGLEAVSAAARECRIEIEPFTT